MPDSFCAPSDPFEPGAVAVVAGGARGIGRACALRLAVRGLRVAVLDVDLDGAARYGEDLTAASVEQELRQLSGDGAAERVDLTHPIATAAAVDRVLERWGRVDHLVVTAGGAVTPYAASLASATTDGDLLHLVDANLGTVVNCCRTVLPHLSAGGSIVTTGSSAGLETSSDGHLAGYGATKAAVHHYTRYLAREVGPRGVRVNCVAPGVIRTGRVVAQSATTGLADAADGVPLGRLGEPDDVAAVVEFLLGRHASYVTGQVLGVNGGAVAS